MAQNSKVTLAHEVFNSVRHPGYNRIIFQWVTTVNDAYKEKKTWKSKRPPNYSRKISYNFDIVYQDKAGRIKHICT